MLNVGEESTTTIDGLSGEGSVVPNTRAQTLVMELKQRDYTFSGSYEAAGLSIAAANARGGYSFTLGSGKALQKVGASGFMPAGSAVKFAPGVGEFWIGKLKTDCLATDPLNLEDADGAPVTLHVGYNASADIGNLKLTGSGTYLQSSALKSEDGLVDGQLAVTGEIGSDAGGNIVLGRKTEGTDPDLSRISAIRAKGALVINTFAPFSYLHPVYSEGDITFLSPAELGPLYKTSGSLGDNGRNVTIRGGKMTLDRIVPAAGGRLTLDGCTVDGGKWSEADALYGIPMPRGVHIGEYPSDAYIAVTNGALVKLGNKDGYLRFGQFAVTGGGAVELSAVIMRATALDRYDIACNGGTIRLCPDQSPNGYSLLEGTSGTVGATYSGKPWTMQVGEKGVRIESGSQSSFSFSANNLYTWAIGAETAAGTDRDGGLALDAPNRFYCCRPFNLNGPVALEGGYVMMSPEAYADTTSVFGTGDFTLGSAWLGLRGANANATETRLASAEGKVFRFERAGRISFREKAADTPMTLVAGDEGATAPAIARGPAGVLFLSDIGNGENTKTKSFDGSAGRFLVKGGVPADAAGRVKLPVFSVTASENNLGFMRYDGTLGFVDFTDYTAGIGGGADSVAWADRSAGTCSVSSDMAVAALRVDGQAGSGAPLTIAAGATLAVGNGTDPACVLLNTHGTSGGLLIDGAGTLDFGTSEGVIAVSRQENSIYQANAQVSAKIAGTGGLTLAGIPGTVLVVLHLNGENEYSGGTRITSLAVHAGSSKAFGTGRVTVEKGSCSGGSIVFSKALTLENPLTVSGLGVRGNGLWCSDANSGAIWFTANATVAGPVTVEGRARISSQGGVGTFAGAISGGGVQLMKSKQPIVFTAANAYTGGTEVVSSTLTLRGPCSAGTGRVFLANGVLRFENDTPITFTNDIEGVGTIVCAGTAPVTFTGKGLEKVPAILKTLQPGWSFDTPSGDNCTVAVGADGLDLGGASLAVGVLNGSGRVENGLLTVTGEIRPGGEGAVGTLTFAPGVLVADGATFVCEVGPDGMDKVVIENAFDLAALKLRTVRIGFCHGVEKILSAEVLTGEFAETVFAKKSHEISYGDTAATLSVGKGMSLIIR